MKVIALKGDVRDGLGKSATKKVRKEWIGKNKNDLVERKSPAGTKNFEIKDVKYV